MFLKTFPPFMTKTTRRKAVMSSRGLPSTAIGFHTGCESSDLVLHADGFRCSGCCRDDGFHGRLSAISYAVDELLKVSSKAPGSNVGSKDDFDLACQSSLERIDADRDSLLHIFESLRVEIADADKFIFVLDRSEERR